MEAGNLHEPEVTAQLAAHSASEFANRAPANIDSSISMSASITAKKSEVSGQTAHLFTTQNHLY
jgi:hypothetical protein